MLSESSQSWMHLGSWSLRLNWIKENGAAHSLFVCTVVAAHWGKIFHLMALWHESDCSNSSRHISVALKLRQEKRSSCPKAWWTSCCSEQICSWRFIFQNKASLCRKLLPSLLQSSTIPVGGNLLACSVSALHPTLKQNIMNNLLSIPNSKHYSVEFNTQTVKADSWPCRVLASLQPVDHFGESLAPLFRTHHSDALVASSLCLLFLLFAIKFHSKVGPWMTMAAS